MEQENSQEEGSSIEPAAQASKRLPIVVVAVVVVLSTSAAFGLSLIQQRPIGDDPSFMLGVGCVLAVLCGLGRRGSALSLGMAAMSGFPVWAVIDLILNGGHTMLPFEFAVYGVYACIGVVVAFFAERLRR